MSMNPLLVMGVMVVLGVTMNFLRFWTFMSGSGSNRRARMSRINQGDAHLSFDERIAERLRELEKDSGSAPAASPEPPVAAPAPQGFGRRGV
ncbi:MAG: hypothetical protein LH466_06830 [Sphingomonas bacterium]|nr:hypothetical protein [Sphingomonas bacterium]